MSRLDDYELMPTDVSQDYSVSNYQQNPMQSLINTSPAIAREVARVFVQTQAALSKPRNYNNIINIVSTECHRKALAEQAIYRYTRGGNDIVGPSIRLAEALARAYGNITFGYEVVSQTKTSTTIRAYALDLETNMQAERTFSVEHVRDNGVSVTPPRDIYEHTSNSASRRVRACILELIPGDIVDYAMDECTATLAETEQINAKKIKNLIEAYKKFGVSQEMLEAFIQRKIEAIEPDQMVKLRQIYGSLVDGIAEVSDFFKPVDNPNKSEAPKQRLSEEKPAKKTSKKEPAKESAKEVKEAIQEQVKQAEKPATQEAEEELIEGPESYQDDEQELLEL